MLGYLFEQVDDMTADFVISQLLLLDVEDPKKDIKLFINSPGGSITAGISTKFYTLVQLSCSFASVYILIPKFLQLRVNDRF